MYHEEEIKAKCERNNILRVYGLEERNLIIKVIWCRFDRHISERRLIDQKIINTGLLVFSGIMNLEELLRLVTD